VEAVRRFGVQGVGQSSWGPTVFAILPNAAAANTLVDQLSTLSELAGTTYTIAAADNRGAIVRK
jgi:beta-ribofuranosylaminobenzene 5'-phosphate synthase